MIRKIYTDLEWEIKFGKVNFFVENGIVKVFPDWEELNIISWILPGFTKKIQIHKYSLPQLTKIFGQIEYNGLSKYIDYEDTRLNGGCYCPRFSVANKTKLSRHTWGIPIDINPTTNKFNTKPTMNMDIIKIFNDNGWVWFGDIKTPDGMHFEPANTKG